MLAEKLKLLRKEKGITQEEFAKDIKVTKGAVAMWETNKRTPDLNMLKDISNYFNISIDWLIGNSDSKTLPAANGVQELNEVYFSIAKDAQEQGIDPNDMRMALEIISKNKKKKDI